MKRIYAVIGNQRGSVLNIALLILTLLVLIGISLSKSSTTDIKIVGNERSHRIAFYSAEGGIDAGSELLEQNLACPAGFTEEEAGAGALVEGVFRVHDLSFWENTAAIMPSDAARDAHFPDDDSGAHTNLTIGGLTVLTPGGALQMVAGYEGKGKGVAGGGAHIKYDIYSQHIRADNSEATVMIQWRHIVGMEGDCNY